MKMSIVLMSFLFSVQAMATRLDAKSYFYIGKGVSIIEPYFEENDGTRFPINVKYLRDQHTPELAYLCSMYTNVPADQVLADAIVVQGTSGMLYGVNDGFSPVSYPHDYDSIYSLMCFSDQHPLVPLTGKTTYSADGSMTVEAPAAQHNGKAYPIVFENEEDADDFCRLIGYSSFETAKISLNRRDQNIQSIVFFIDFDDNKFFFSPRIEASNDSTFWSLDSFTCKAPLHNTKSWLQ